MPPYFIIAALTIAYLLLYTGIKDPVAPPGVPQIVAVARGIATPKPVAKVK
jgi:hypothetical protein